MEQSQGEPANWFPLNDHDDDHGTVVPLKTSGIDTAVQPHRFLLLTLRKMKTALKMANQTSTLRRQDAAQTCKNNIFNVFYRCASCTQGRSAAGASPNYLRVIV